MKRNHHRGWESPCRCQRCSIERGVDRIVTVVVIVCVAYIAAHALAAWAAGRL